MRRVVEVADPKTKRVLSWRAIGPDEDEQQALAQAKSDWPGQEVRLASCGDPDRVYAKRR